jgi:hypothetical protein
MVVFLGGKRIAIGGLAASTMVFFLLKHSDMLRKTIQKNGFKIFVVLFLVFVGQLWIDIYSGKYDSLITDITGVPPYAFFTGRLEIFSMFFDSKPDESNYFLGYGIGYIENVLYYKSFFSGPLCNDFIRLYMELGGILFVAWCLIMTKHTTKNHVAFASFVLLLFLMQTDNALMYECIMYPFYLIVSYSLLDYREKKANREKGNSCLINN